jgi:N-acetylneuraminic acid mutarotase
VYGTLGTPAPGNIPGGRYGMAVWTDSSGNFWLFGGQGVDANGTTGYLNDLWKFSPSTNEWTWISGSSTTIDTSPYGTSGVYGTMGTPAPGNTPGGRQTASSWIDKSGNLWLFGGYGDGASGTGSNGPLNDLWVFNPSTVEWTWMGGSDSTNNGFGQAGIYGTQGTPSAGNIPGSRGEAATWTDSTGNVWLFGGGAQDANDQEGSLNDLWEYFPSTNQWAWMGGCNTVTCNGVGPSGSGGPGGVYGTMGTPAPGNIPGGRGSATNWIDSKGNFWIFGGAGQDVNGFDGVLNDVWEYTPSTAEWTWMGGSNSIGSSFLGQPGVYGTEGVPAAANIPGGRESSDFWTDSSGNFWLFGGIAVDGNGNYGFLNDLWEFSPAANEWTWMAGTDTVSGAAAGVYGTLGTPSPGNDPGGRQFSLGWTDTHGNLWLFGGDANDINGEEGYLNDAWEYQVSTLPAIISFVANPSTIAPGASSTLTGVFSNGTGVITPGNISVTSGTGVSVSPTATTTYTLTVTPTTGTAVTQTATVTVTTIVPTITSFVANPATITSGSSSTLTGVFSNGTGVITPGNISVTSGTGVSVSPTATTIYTLTVTPTAGTAVTKTTTVTVQPGKPVPAALTSPKSGSTFISNKVTFTWTAGVGATMYDLYLGTTVGSNNLYQTGHTTALSTTATVPTNGATVYARLLSYINGAWQFNDYTFTEGSMALLTSPVQGSTLTGASVTFKWTTGTNAADYDLYVGSTGVGSNNVYQTGHITATSATATNLPTTGAKLYVRLLSLINGSWQYVDYTFTEAMPAGTPAALTSPANGATLGSSNVTFTWTSGTDVTEYDLYLGTTVGSNNLYQTGHITAMTTTVPKIPSSGATVYARLLSLINGTWQYNDYTFTEP